MTEAFPVHTLVFDLDDTLYAEREFVLSGFHAVDVWMAERHGVKGFFEAAGRIFAAGRRGRIFDEALPMLGVEPSAGLVADLLSVYRTHEPRISLFLDAREILGWATSRMGLALITDGFSKVQNRKIRALGLDTAISCRIVTDELGREFWKPHPESYRRVMSQFPGRAEGYLYVGDNPRKDFIGARGLGWRTIRIRRPIGEHAAYEGGPDEVADLEIESLFELKGLIA
jgi:putative hydrolase of the HAD superfamily